tara:strand:+ start:5440 stop:6600 length:1161 start_codon:yes stop_codon:yes gene_type:complete
VNTITPDTQNLTPFNPSDALPAPRVKGTLLPFSVKKFGEDKDVQFDTPEFVDSMIESFKLPGKALTGQLGIASIDNPMFTQGATQFTSDFGLNLALLNAVRAPSAVKTGQLNIIASHNAKDGPKILKKHVDMIAKEGMDATFQKNKSFQDPIDGRLSFEIDTSKMSIPEKFTKTKTFENQQVKLTDILQGMPDLFKQYPQLKKVKVFMSDDRDIVSEGGGAASILTNEIILDKVLIKLSNRDKISKEMLEETVMHEVQHFVDNIERRSAGSSPSSVFAQIADGNEGAVKRALKIALATDIYKNNAGEVRARMVEQRLKKGMEGEFPDPDVSPENIIKNEDLLLELVNQSKGVPKLRDVMKGQDESFMRQTNRSLLKAVKGERDDGI